MKRNQVLYLDRSRVHINTIYQHVASLGYPVLVSGESSVLLSKIKKQPDVDVFLFGELDVLYDHASARGDYGRKRADYLTQLLLAMRVRPFVVNITNVAPTTAQCVRLEEAGVDVITTKPIDPMLLNEWLTKTHTPAYRLPKPPELPHAH